MFDKLMDIIKEHDYEVDDEVSLIVEQFTEVLKAKKSNDDVTEIITWLEQKRKEYKIDVKEIGINELDKWHVEQATGNIYHESGKFYTIMGVKVSGAEEREVPAWTQPMMKQQECGILGILCKKINGLRHYLLQAKFEPGNTERLQLSPTLQATASNLKRAHAGRKPLFAEYFEEGGIGKVIVSVEGVEDGGRFYLKTNRSMLVEVPEDEQLEVPDNFIWVNLYQLRKLMKMDIVANSLTREVMGSY
jgi:oxidase EvaA